MFLFSIHMILILFSVWCQVSTLLFCFYVLCLFFPSPISSLLLPSHPSSLPSFCLSFLLSFTPLSYFPSFFPPSSLSSFWVSLAAMFWLHWYPDSIQNICFSWPFRLWGRSRSCMVCQAHNMLRIHYHDFRSLLFHWMALGRSIYRVID